MALNDAGIDDPGRCLASQSRVTEIIERRLTSASPEFISIVGDG
jgi:hypothetical protein